MQHVVPASEWHDRARALNLEWVKDTPRRNDIPTLVRCLDCGSEWLVQPANIARGRKSCSKCANASARVSAAEWISRLTIGNAEWVEGTPETNNDQSKLAKCLVCNQIWTVRPRNATKGHPYCKGKLNKQKLVGTTWQERAKKVNLRRLEEPKSSKSKTPAECLVCGELFSPTPSNVTSGSGCPKCSRKNGRVIPRPNAPTNKGKGQLKITQREWGERASKLNIVWLEDVSSRHTKTQARCLTCGHEWLANPGSITQGSGCPKCKNLARNLERRISPEIWQLRAGEQNLVWLEEPENNSTKKKIQCQTCHFEWAARPDLIQRGVGCPKCSGTLVEEKDWLERASSVGLRWLELPKGSRTPTKAECLTCGLVWKTNPGAVATGTGCPDCAETGYKVGQPGLFYWVERDNSHGRAARKIGITNVASSKVRLSLWRRQGFSLVRQITHENGAIILRLEQDLLRWLRHDLAIPQYLDPEEMPKGGATETLPRDLPSDFVLNAKIDEVFLTVVNNHQG